MKHSALPSQERRCRRRTRYGRHTEQRLTVAPAACERACGVSLARNPATLCLARSVAADGVRTVDVTIPGRRLAVAPVACERA